VIRTATSAYAVEVRPATIGDASALAAALARSFDTCPAWQWYLPPDSRNRPERMERSFAHLLAELYLRPGHESVTTADRTGAALWDRPNQWKLGTRAYLETGRPRSRDFFARHGFTVTEELRLPGGGPPVWRMWREPNDEQERA
jgi:hypothetical protein